jgi:hypothetical protein
MSRMLIDGIRSITLHGNVMRIHCFGIGAEGKQEDAGTILIPGNEVGPVVQALVTGLKEMEKQMRERAAAAEPKPSAD